VVDLMESWETAKLSFDPNEDDYSAVGTFVPA
jgi:hypothetical protein